MIINASLEEGVYYGWKDMDGNVHLEFDENKALSELLLNEIVFLNSYHWKTDWTQDSRKVIAICVVCNDCFYYACSDAEELLYDELQDLYDHYILDKIYGPIVWCCKKRNQYPLREIYNKIQERGVWNLDEYNLKDNLYWKKE